MGDANVNRQASAVTSIKRITTEVLADAYAGDQFVLQQQLQTLQRHFENLTLIHENLLGTVQANGVDALDTLLADMETRYNGAMAKLQRMLAAIEPAVQLRNMDDGASSVSNATVHQRVPGVKLEALKIPKFDGQLENWLAFKDAFETLIHSQEWPEAYKLGKLGDYLGDGAKSVLGARYTGGYEAAWAAVIKRFHKPRYLASIHISKLLNMPSGQQETRSNLLSIVDTVGVTIRALTVMELPVDQWDTILVEIVQSKLPTTTLQTWGMELRDQELPKLSQLVTYLECRADTLPLVGTQPVITPQRNDGASNGTRRRPAMMTNSTNSPRLVKSNLAAASPGHCTYCNDQSHNINRCPRLLELPVAERFKKLQGSNLCFNCLRVGHSTKSCSSGTCRKCNGRHHTLLCRADDTNTATSNIVATTTASSASTPASAVAAPPTNWPRSN